MHLYERGSSFLTRIPQVMLWQLDVKKCNILPGRFARGLSRAGNESVPVLVTGYHFDPTTGLSVNSFKATPDCGA
jgi:hypothetical protein